MKKALAIFLVLFVGCKGNQEGKIEKDQAQIYLDTTSILSKTNETAIAPGKNSQEKTQRITALKKEFRVKKDEFNNITFYRCKSWGNSWPDRKCLYSYFSSNGDLCLVSNYYSDDWIFHTKCQLIICGENFETPTVETFRPLNKTQNTGEHVWENIVYTEETEDIIKSIAYCTNKPIKVRFIGRQYFSDFNMNENDKKAFRKTWELYTLMFK